MNEMHVYVVILCCRNLFYSQRYVREIMKRWRKDNPNLDATPMKGWISMCGYAECHGQGGMGLHRGKWEEINHG